MPKLLFLSLLIGCAHKARLEPSDEKDILAKSKWEDITLSESLISPAQATIDTDSGSSSYLSYKELMQTEKAISLNTFHETLSNLDHNRRLSFYLGLAGGIYSFVADNQGNVRGRTIGNALWGIGWTCWLGFGAIVRADIRQIMDEHNETISANGAAGTTPSVTDYSRSSWALLWQLRSF